MTSQTKPSTPPSSDDETSSRSSENVNNKGNHSGKSNVDPRDVCQYKKGRCKNARAMKRNGKPHTLCEFHRNKQIEYQRNFDKKTRESRQATKRKGSDASPTGSSSGSEHTMQSKRSKMDGPEKSSYSYGGSSDGQLMYAYPSSHAPDQRMIPPYMHPSVAADAFGMMPQGMSMMPQMIPAGLLPHGVNFSPQIVAHPSMFQYPSNSYFHAGNGRPDAQDDSQFQGFSQGYYNAQAQQQQQWAMAQGYYQQMMNPAESVKSSKDPKAVQYGQRQCAETNNVRLPKLPQLQHA